MSRVRPYAATAALISLAMALFVAIPARAATTSLYSLDFEGGGFAPWTQSGGDATTLSVIDADTKVLSVNRTADYVGVESPAGDFEAGATYTFTMRAKLANAGAGTAQMRFVMKPAYTWIGNATINDSEWTTVSGTLAIPTGTDTSGFSVYIGTDAASVAGENFTYLIDDLVVTGETADEEPCTPETVTDLSSDFESTLAPWSGRGASVGQDADARTGSGAMLVSGRTASWNGAAVDATSLLTEGTYTISAWVKRPAADVGTIQLNFGVNQPGAANEYPWVGGRLSVGPDTWVEIGGTFTVDAEFPPAQLYIESDSADQSFLVDDVTITHQSVCSDGPEPGTVAISTDFEDGLDGWGPRDNGTGAPTVDVTTADAHGGLQAALVSDRTSQGSGIRFDVTDALVAGATYEVTAWLKFAQTPTEDIWMTLESTTGSSTSYSTLAQFTGMSSSEWVQVQAQFTMPPADAAFLYFETAYEGGDTGNTSSFMIDDITVVVPEPPVVQDLTPIKDTVDFPFGVAIDNREVIGTSSELLLKHFDQITPENYMKPEAWYDADGNFAPNSAQIDPLMDFAAENGLRLYGHVLVWHSQTPDWFFQDDEDQWLTNSESDKAILRQRMHDHIDNVAEYLSDGWGEFGSDTNPLVAFDVVNEVIDDSSAYADGMRRSRWYQVLGEEFVDDAFAYANEAFNGTYAADGADHPVTLFINDYNTEQSGKRARYLALVDRLLGRGAPVDGIGQQFHLSLATPVENLQDALDDAATRGLKQAVTEFDVTTGTPESQAKFIDQGYYYRDAFNIFRSFGEQMFSVTVWGLIDSRSWRDSSGGPLVFDDGLQAKPAYYGIVEGYSDEDPLPARLRTANSFEGSVALDGTAATSEVWKRLPLLPIESAGSFQTRWEGDHLTVYVDVPDATDDAADGVEIQVGDETYAIARDGSGDASAVAQEVAGGYRIVARVPLDAAVEGDTIELDVRVSEDGDVSGWNTPGVLGTVTLVEPLSYTEIPEAIVAPVIDGATDAVWSAADVVTTSKEVQGTGGAIGTFSTLWKDNTLYVHAFVSDPTIDVSGSDPWTQDSVEIYVDGGNVKNGSYRYDDTQIRINAENVQSFGAGDEAFQANRVQSATAIVDGGYVVEAAISLLEYGGEGTFQGVDFQVNDAAGGARSAIRNWADPTGAGYQSTSRWGVAKLVGPGTPAQAEFTPVVLGKPVVGSTLTIGGLPTGTTLAYRWLRDGAPIPGAVGSTYTLGSSDAGHRISVRVTSTLTGWLELTETSAQTAKVVKTFSKTYAPVISGTPKIGYTLRARVHAWSPNASFSFQWYADGRPIRNATGTTYKVTRWVGGKHITVKVTGKRTGYAPATRVSSSRYIPAMPIAVRGVSLHGPTRVGGTLVVSAGTTSPATTKSYQWYRNGAKIPGATSARYTIPYSALGSRLCVRITYRATGCTTRSIMVGPTYRVGPSLRAI